MISFTLDQLNVFAKEYTSMLHKDYPFSYEHSVRHYSIAFVSGFVKYLETISQEPLVDLPLECCDDNPWETLTARIAPVFLRGHDDTSGF